MALRAISHLAHPKGRHHTNRKKVESLILLIDFKKAFDSVSHKYIYKCLKMFNFGPSIWKWVYLFFSQACSTKILIDFYLGNCFGIKTKTKSMRKKIREAYILLGGELTKKILLEHGVAQGDIVAPYVFLAVIAAP